MKELNIFEITKVSGGMVKIKYHGSEFEVKLTDPTDMVNIAGFTLKGDGKAFLAWNIYVETSEIPKEVYTINQYYTISKSHTLDGYQFKIVLL